MSNLDLKRLKLFLTKNYEVAYSVIVRQFMLMVELVDGMSQVWD